MFSFNVIEKICMNLKARSVRPKNGSRKKNDKAHHQGSGSKDERQEKIIVKFANLGVIGHGE